MAFTSITGSGQVSIFKICWDIERGWSPFVITRHVDLTYEFTFNYGGQGVIGPNLYH